MTDSDIEDISEIEIDIDVEKDMTPILLEDLGNRFPTENSKKKARYGRYKCQYCGKEFEAISSEVKSKHTKSCGCLQGEKHNSTGDRLYKIWIGIKKRCYNQNYKAYKNYGGRGISVCDEWKNSYISFRDWSLNNGYDDELSIDRINVNGNYEPSNCRWTTNEIQARNTRLLMSTNKSGYRGVSWAKDRSKWKVQIVVNTKRIYIGQFDTAIEGAIAYNNYITENNLEHTINPLPKECQ